MNGCCNLRHPFFIKSIEMNIHILTEERIINKIYLIRDKKVMLDRDLAECMTWKRES